MIFIRSLLFNIVFYGYTIFCCLLFMPSFLFPRPVILWVTRFWTRGVAVLEKYILGLTYEIRGQEHLPKDGTYIVAAKHQSAYETLKLHALFDDPTIVLKKELIGIPVFGTFLKKVDVIPIDRKNKESAMKAIVDGAKRMEENNRPIVIFPQGTRVPVHCDANQKKYKGGIAKMHSHTDIPIIPLALNSGLFWPKNSFIKRPGKVIFEFLPAIESDISDKEMMQTLATRIEQKTYDLMSEAQSNNKHVANIEIAKPALTA